MHHKRSYFETVGILQKAGVDLGKMDGHKSSGHGETAIDIDMIPRVRPCGRCSNACCHGSREGAAQTEPHRAFKKRVKIAFLTSAP